MSTTRRSRWLPATLALISLILSSCSEEDDDGSVPEDGGEVDDGAVFHSCADWYPAGAACDFTDSCSGAWDGMEGLCGPRFVRCEDGRTVVDDDRFPCSPFEDGGGGGEDGRDDAGSEIGETVTEDRGTDVDGGT